MTIDAEDRGQVKCDRRAVLASITGLGIGTAVFHRALAQQVTATLTVTPEMIQQAEWVAGLELADVDRDQVARRVQSALGRVAEMRNVTVGYDVPPALAIQRGSNDASRRRTRPQ